MICSEFVYRCYNEAVEAENNPYALQIKAIQALEGGATAAPLEPHVRAAGIQPESMVARLATAPHWAATINDAKAALAAKVVGAAPSHAEVDSLAEQYLAEVSAAEVASTVTPISDDLVGSIRNFALSMRDLGLGRIPGPESSTPAAPAATSVFDHFFSTVADFVTPGDLLKTPSLRDVGKIE